MRKKKLNRHLSGLPRSILKLASLSLLLLALAFIYQQAFTVRQISCSLGTDPCPDPVLAEINRLKDKSLILIKTAPIRDKIVGSDPAIVSASFNLSLPGKIDLQLQKSLDLAQISPASASAVFVISSDYKVSSLLETQSSSLDLIISPKAKDLQVGEKIEDQELLKSLEAVSLLRSHFIPFRQLSTNGYPASVVLKNGIQVYLDLTKNISRQVKSLQLILSQLPADRQPISIDIGLDRPAIKYP